MGIIKANCVTLAAAVMIGSLILVDQRVSGQCEAQLGQLVKECSKCFQKNGPKFNPTPACCKEARKVDIPCACKKVTPEVEKKISMDKALQMSRSCGLKIEPGFKCGSYTVP